MTTSRALSHLVAAAGLLNSIQRGRRGGALWLALPFVPCADDQIEGLIPQLRAMLASIWEDMSGGAVPIVFLRELLTDPRPSWVAIRLGRLNVAGTSEDLSNALAELIGDVIHRSNGSRPQSEA